MPHFLVSASGRALDLHIGIADRLNEVANADLVEELADALAVDRPGLSAALRETVLSDLEFRAVEDFLGRIAESVTPSERLRQLNGPVGAIPSGGIAWAANAAREGKLPGTGTVTFALKGTGKTTFKVLPGPAYDLRGELGIANSLKAPFSFGRIALSGRRSVRSRLTAKFSHPDTARVLEALARDLPVLARLNDPEALLDSKSFKSARLTVTGKARFGARMKTGRSWIRSVDAEGHAIPVKLKAGASYTLDWTRTGDFRFSIGRAAGGRMRVWLTEAKTNRGVRSLSIGAEAGARGLRQSIASVMDRMAALPDRLDGFVKIYSRPSALLRDKLRMRLKASDPSVDPSVLALADIMVGGGDRAAKRFVDALVGAIVDSANARTEHWTNLMVGNADQVVEGALDALPIPEERREDVAALASGVIAEALDDLNEALLDDLKSALRERAAPVAEALAQFAEIPADIADDLDAAAERLLTPLKRLLARHRALEEQIANAVEAAERERLAVEYGRAVTKRRVSKALLKLRLDPRTEDGKKLYRQMLAGDFAEAMAAGMDTDNDAVVLESCVFKRMFERKAISGFTFNLLGREIASRRALSTEIKVEHAAGGQINVFEAGSEVSEEHAAFGEGQSMRAGGAMDFIAGADAPDAFAVHLNYTDRNMTRKELRQYLKSLEDAGLIAEGATARVMESDTAPAAPGASGAPGTSDPGKRSLSINTAFALSRDEFLEIAAQDADKIVRVAIDEQLKASRRIPWAGKALDRLAGATMHDVADLIFVWRGHSRRRMRRKLGIAGRQMSKTQRDVLHLVSGIGGRADKLAGFVAKWRELDRIGESTDRDADRLDDARLKEIRCLHGDATADLGTWVDARNWLVGLAREDVSPVAAAFLASLRRLSPRAEEPLIPVIALSEDGEERRVAVV